MLRRYAGTQPGESGSGPPARRLVTVTVRGRSATGSARRRVGGTPPEGQARATAR
ncbi:hypothetical protein [Salana multivorans]